MKNLIKIKFEELKLDKNKLRKIFVAGIYFTIGFYIIRFTKFDDLVKEFLLRIPGIGVIFEYEVMRIFFMGMLIFYIKNSLEIGNGE